MDDLKHIIGRQMCSLLLFQPWFEYVARGCLFIFVAGALVGCQVSLSFTPTPTAQPIRAIGESTLNVVEAWRFSTGPSNSGFSTPPHLFVSGGKVIISYGAGKQYGDEHSASCLTAISLETGQVVWQTRLVNPGFGTRLGSAYMDAERLYLEYSFQVNTFDVETGQLLWSTPNLGDHTSYWFVPWEPDTPLFLHSSNREKISIEPQTGTVLSRQSDDPAWLKAGQVEFMASREGLYAIDQQTGQTLWSRLELQPTYRQLQQWPSFVENDIVFESGDPCYNIVRANIRTGQVAWETSRTYLSNFTLAGSQLYALREDLMLVAFDLDSGAMVGTLKFDGPPASTICTHSGSDVYWVVAEEKYILVYLGDTQELIALKQTD